MFGWLRRDHDASLSDADWSLICHELRLLDPLAPSELLALRAAVSRFLARKTFHAMHGQVIDQRLRLVVAALCCLPALHLSGDPLAGWRDVILYPGAFRAHRHAHDDDGVAHEFDEDLIGEADEQSGPILLSVADIEADLAEPFAGINVVIHEIAHKIDARDGACDGVPVIRDVEARRDWKRVMQDAFDRLVATVALAESRGDEEIDCAIDPYAAESPEEFFAVASEAYFSDPDALQAFDTGVFEQFRRFYRAEI